MSTYEHIGGPDPELCEYAGHEWAPAGGGLLICMQCEAEKWDDEEPPRASGRKEDTER